MKKDSYENSFGFCFKGRNLYCIKSSAGTYATYYSLSEGINIVYFTKANHNYVKKNQSLTTTITDKESLNVINCVQNSDGTYDCRSAPGYIKDTANYYNLVYNGKAYVSSEINNAAEHQNDCKDNVGGLIQPYGTGAIYFCISEERGIKFDKQNKEYLIKYKTDDENIFADNSNYSYLNFSIKFYYDGEYSGVLFNNLASNKYILLLLLSFFNIMNYFY